MNILIITKNYYPATIPDAKRFTGFANYFASKGHKVNIITETFGARTTKDNINIIKTKKIAEDSKGMLSRLVNHISFMLQSIIKGKKLSNIDVIIATSPPLFNLISGNVLKKKLKAYYFVDLRDIWPEVFEQTGVLTTKSLIYKLFDLIAKNSYNTADKIVVVTRGKKELLMDKYPQHKNKITYISNGFNKSILEIENDDNITSNFEGYFNIIYTGKIGLAQNIKEFIDLAIFNRHNTKLKFHIMGNGKGINKMLEYIDKENLSNIKYYGYRSEREVITALRHSQVAFVSLNNKNLKDSIPTKIYEAMVCGCPILISAVGESVELVESMNFGLSSEPGNYKLLRENLNYMIHNYDIFDSRKNRVLFELSQLYSREVTAEQYLEEILTSKNRNHSLI